MSLAENASIESLSIGLIVAAREVHDRYRYCPFLIADVLEYPSSGELSWSLKELLQVNLTDIKEPELILGPSKVEFVLSFACFI